MDAVAYVFTGDVLRRNLLLALVVGCVLSVGNQFDVLRRQPVSPWLLMKVFFNFLIPFVVSSASAALNRNGA